jgi:hypothetical protein
MKSLVFYLLMILLSFTSCQKEDMISKYNDISIDSTMVQDTVGKRIKLYEFVDKISSKKEPVKVQKRKRLKFRDFIKLKFRKG